MMSNARVNPGSEWDDSLVVIFVIQVFVFEVLCEVSGDHHWRRLR